MNRNRIISIIICTLNKGKSLKKTLDSILEQSADNYEVIIVDGKSKDQTLDIIKEYKKKFGDKINWISENDSGIYDAMNKGVKMAKGEYLNIIGAGDWLEKNALRIVYKCIKNSPRADAVYGRLKMWEKNLEKNYIVQTHPNSLIEAPMQHPALFYKKTLHNKFGMYDEKYKIAADYLFCLKAFYIGDATIATTTAIVSNYVLDGISSTNLELCEKENSYIYESLNLTSSHLISKIKQERIARKKAEEDLHNAEVELHQMRASLRWKIGNYPYKIYCKKIKPHLPKQIFLVTNFLVLTFKRAIFAIKKNGYGFYCLLKNHIPQRAYFTIGIASYNHSKYLEKCIKSCLNQDYKYFDIVIVDDCSSDPENRKILKKYENNPKINIIFKNKNEGISASLNDQVLNAKGNWVAFVDCDDFLPKNALSAMALYIKMHPEKKLVFSNRIEVDENDNFLQKVDFKGRFKNQDIFKSLIKGMFSSHLKIIHKDVFKKVGLFDHRFGGTHDYDMFLRVAFYMSESFGFINEYLYYHRIHSGQNTLVDSKKHNKNVQKIKKEALFRKKIYDGNFLKKVSIIILSFNRYEQTKNTIENIFSKTKKSKIEFDLLIWDNASQDKRLKTFLNAIDGKRNTRVVFSRENIRAAGGREESTKLVDGDYVLYFDNDIEIRENLLEEMIIRIEENEKISSCCAKIIFPNNKIQYTGGLIKNIGNKQIEFILDNNGLEYHDLKTMVKKDYDWLGTGATMTKRKYIHLARFDRKFINAYEDNDYYMQFVKSGLRLVHCPTASVIHHHINFQTAKDVGTQKYVSIRHNNEAFIKSWIYFYKKWGLIIRDSFILKLAGLSDRTTEEIEKYLDDAYDD